MTSARGSTITPYPHRMGGHCGSGALRDLMHWAGLGWGEPPSEGMVFALGGALDIAYARTGEMVPPIYLVGRGGDLEVDLPKRLGATVSMHSTDDADLGWTWVRDRIDDGQPVMVWGDIGELPYLRVRLQMSRHDIVIIGYDNDRRIAFVVDNDREEVQEVPYDALARARASTSFPVPTRHTLYDIAWPAAVPPLQEVAGEAFAQAAATMRGSSGSVIAAVDTGMVGARGLEAAQLFASDILTWRQLFANDELHVVLLGLGAFIEKAGTGGGLFRRLLASGSAEIAEHLGSRDVNHLATAARNCARAWTEVAHLAWSKDCSVDERWRDAGSAAQALPGLESALADALDAAALSLQRARLSR